MTDWFDVCRAAVRDVRAVLAELPTRALREPVVGTGMGGDETTAVDDAVETAVVERLRASGADLVLVSEELGTTTIGRGGTLHVALDPIDGSLNAKRGIPYFALSLAVATGPTIGEVTHGYLYDFGTGEEWTARRGLGAFLNGERLGAERPKDVIEVLALEATRTRLVAETSPALVGLATRLRIMGSLALSLCHLAAGRIDGVCSLRPTRSVDIAAAQLVLAECGLAIDLPDARPLWAAPLDVTARSRVVAAGSEERCAELASALRG